MATSDEVAQDPYSWGLPIALGTISIALSAFAMNGAFGSTPSGTAELVAFPAIFVGCLSILLGVMVYRQAETA